MLKNFKSLNKIQKLSLLLLILVVFCRIAGTTSAWLMSEDALNNHFGVRNHYVDIQIKEDNWDSVGSEQAQKMQPGMDIFKDPRTQNLSDEYCYIRMKIEITDTSGNALSEERQAAILGSIKNYNSNASFTDYPNLNSNDFTKYGDWYYYTSGSLCRRVAPLESTTPLFTDVVIPKLKSEYVHFNSPFAITVRAEAVFASGIVEADASLANVSARFDSVSIGDESISALELLGEQRARQRYTYYQPVESGSAVSVSTFGEVQ